MELWIICILVFKKHYSDPLNEFQNCKIIYIEQVKCINYTLYNISYKTFYFGHDAILNNIR